MCLKFNTGANMCGSAANEKGSRKKSEDCSAAAIVKKERAYGGSNIIGQRHLR